MPLYEYECSTCDEVVEILVRHQRDKAECPDCGSEHLVRVMSAPAAPATIDRQALPVAGREQDCGAPRCCGGGCDLA